MVLAAKAVKEGEADAVLSAGNTGALLAAGFFIVGRIKNIDRPGLMSTLPTVDGKGFDMLDLGANAENTAQHLLKMFVALRNLVLACLTMEQRVARVTRFVRKLTNY